MLPSPHWILPASRTKNGKPHIVHLSNEAIAVLMRAPKLGKFVFSLRGTKPFESFSAAKRELDKLSGVSDWRLHDLRRTCVSGMARLGVAPHVADKLLNHQTGTISGVAAVYQRHEFLAACVQWMFIELANARAHAREGLHNIDLHKPRP